MDEKYKKLNKKILSYIFIIKLCNLILIVN